MHSARWLSKLVLVLLIPLPQAHGEPDLAALAQCISDSGARYYGAHWCPQCRRQSAMFGQASRYLPYIECSETGSRRQLQRCERIEAYPTWIFANDRAQTGVRSLESLASSTGCPLEEISHFRYPLD